MAMMHNLVAEVLGGSRDFQSPPVADISISQKYKFQKSVLSYEKLFRDRRKLQRYLDKIFLSGPGFKPGVLHARLELYH